MSTPRPPTDRAGPVATGTDVDARCVCGALLAWVDGTGWSHIADVCATCYATTSAVCCPESDQHGTFVLLTPDGARECSVAPLCCLACALVLEVEANCFVCGGIQCCGCCDDEPDGTADAAYERLRDDHLR